jgi:hypothetical protein
MSQPLSGQVRRRLHELSVHEGWFLLALADMVDSNTKQWREPWPKLTTRFGHKNQWCIRRLAYRLRDTNWLSIRSDGRGIIITLHPDRGRPTLFGGSQVANPVSNQVAKRVSNQIAKPVGEQVANGVGAIDTPPHTPPRGNAPRTPLRGGGGDGPPKGGTENWSNGKSPPASAKRPARTERAQTVSVNDVHVPLNGEDKINVEKQLKRVEAGIDRIENSYEAHMGRDEWSQADRTRIRELKARRKELLAALQWEA